jgi:hypothetical protein
MPFKHNRKRNPALVYEFLVRRLSAQALAGDRPGARRTLGIVRKHFSSGSALALERELFDAVRRTRDASPEAARRVLGEVRVHARRADPRELDRRKGDLIRDVNYAFGREFYAEHRVPEYKLLASVQVVLDGWRRERGISEDVELLGLEEDLVRFMTTSEPAERAFAPERRVDSVTLALAERKFQERYGSSLSGHQRRLLRAYVRDGAGGEQLSALVRDEVARVRAVLSEGMRSELVSSDPVMGSRLQEALDRVGRVPALAPAESVQELMLYQRLADELESPADE